jgi:hypothetical protein
MARKKSGVSAADFRRIALGFAGAVEGSHMGAADFRVGGHIFATLAAIDEGYGNLMLTPDAQAPLIDELPDAFVPIKGGWGKMGMTHVVLKVVDEEVLAGALQTAYRLRVAKNTKAKKPPAIPRKKRPSR